MSPPAPPPAAALGSFQKACGLILHTLHVPNNNESGCAKMVGPDQAETIDITQVRTPYDSFFGTMYKYCKARWGV